jgi:hypothetical protein
LRGVDVEKALVRIGGPAVPRLRKVLTGPDADMRLCAAWVLGRIGPPALAAIPDLIDAIERPRKGDPFADELKSYAIGALGRIGPEPRGLWARAVPPDRAHWR